MWGYVITNCGYCGVLSVTCVYSLSNRKNSNHNSWIHNQLTAIAVKKTACDGTLLYVTWWWSYDRNMLCNNIRRGREELLRWRIINCLMNVRLYHLTEGIINLYCGLLSYDTVYCCYIYIYIVLLIWPPLWSSRSEFLATDPDVRVLFLALPNFPRSSGSETGAAKPRECNWGAAWKK
jgi:hypothetical protein